MEVINEIVKLVEEYIENNHLSLSEFGEIAHLNAKSISDVLVHHKPIGAKVIKKLSRYCGFNQDELEKMNAKYERRKSIGSKEEYYEEIKRRLLIYGNTIVIEYGGYIMNRLDAEGLKTKKKYVEVGKDNESAHWLIEMERKWNY